MKSVFFLLIFAGFTLFACQDDTAPDTCANLQEGKITGQDYRKCACCGGWFLQTADTTYMFVSLPEGSDIDLQNATFPIPVKFDFTPDSSICNGFLNRIILTHIEVQ